MTWLIAIRNHGITEWLRLDSRSLCNLFQGLVTHIVKNCFLMFRRHLLCLGLCPLPHHLTPLKRVFMSLLYWGTEYSTPGVVSPAVCGGKGSPPLTSWQHFASCSSGYHYPLNSKGTLLAYVQAAFQLSGPQHVLVLGLFLPWCRTLHITLLNFMRFMPAHFSNLPMSLWMASLTNISATPPSFSLPGGLTLPHYPDH